MNDAELSRTTSKARIIYLTNYARKEGWDEDCYNQSVLGLIINDRKELESIIFMNLECVSIALRR